MVERSCIGAQDQCLAEQLDVDCISRGCTQQVLLKEVKNTYGMVWPVIVYPDARLLSVGGLKYTV